MSSRLTNILFLSLLLTVFTSLVGAETPFDVRLHIELSGMKQAREPFVLNRNLILSYKADHPIRFVGAAFEHEDYKKVHTFVTNEYDVFILAYPLSTERTTIRYRIVVDGLWMTDPNNPSYFLDEHAIRISEFTVPEIPEEPITGPKITDSGEVTFYFKGREDASVFLTGNFNNWDPFMYEMDEINKGFYSITLPLSPGEYYYSFIVGARILLDPFNYDRGTVQGTITSYFAY